LFGARGVGKSTWARHLFPQAHILDLLDEELYHSLLLYWSPTESRENEVDFLFRRGREYLAIEVKAAKHLSSPHVAGLRAIAGLNGLVRRILVYAGTRRLKSEEQIDIYPVARLRFDWRMDGV
jgi:predicted AAA+ superfamily ATPase